ncbi:Protein of unknown function [Pyronema omphalodes CBS 100304]|uniref:Uncharacterized protein n=1 Tax=Pyronema omphalodes (strain CBS 100304) TaxID=1076935 RepID=U4LN88_PYROM|nr:Protein of unknown function [Pyronema omphalodes CBS 100304]
MSDELICNGEGVRCLISVRCVPSLPRYSVNKSSKQHPMVSSYPLHKFRKRPPRHSQSYSNAHAP